MCIQAEEHKNIFKKHFLGYLTVPQQPGDFPRKRVTSDVTLQLPYGTVKWSSESPQLP